MWPIKCHLHHHVVLMSDISAFTASTQNFDLSTLRDFYLWLIWRSGQERGSGEVDVMFSHSWKPSTHVLFVKHPHTNLSLKTWIYHVCLTWLLASGYFAHVTFQSVVRASRLFRPQEESQLILASLVSVTVALICIFPPLCLILMAFARSSFFSIWWWWCLWRTLWSRVIRP